MLACRTQVRRQTRKGAESKKADTRPGKPRRTYQSYDWLIATVHLLDEDDGIRYDRICQADFLALQRRVHAPHRAPHPPGRRVAEYQRLWDALCKSVVNRVNTDDVKHVILELFENLIRDHTYFARSIMKAQVASVPSLRPLFRLST